MIEKNQISPGGLFPPTRRSAVMLVGSDDPAERARAFETVVRAYWKPVYKHIRIRWKRVPEDAGDLTQGFFARAFEKRYFAGYEPAKARFRTFLKLCLDRYVMESARSAKRHMRGGDAIKLSLDFDVAEQEIAGAGPVADVEAYFDREWTRSLFGAVVAALEARCRSEDKVRYFEVFKRYTLDGDTSYADVAHALGLSVSDVTNYLSWARREFRALAMQELRELTSSDEEFRAEARALFGTERER